MIVAMRVKTADDVPGSKNLRVYTFESPEEELTVVANLTNVYQVGDVALVAKVGTVLGELTVSQRKVFGIQSSGMAVGKTDLEVGTVVPDTKIKLD